MKDDPGSRLRFLDHTADLGLEAEGRSLESVIETAALGMTRLVLGEESPPDTEERSFEVNGGDPALLLRNVLREVLFLHAGEGFALARAHVELVEAGDPPLRARCRVRGGADPRQPHTELKGVTLHELTAERRAGGEWYARVIFDV